MAGNLSRRVRLPRLPGCRRGNCGGFLEALRRRYNHPEPPIRPQCPQRIFVTEIGDFNISGSVWRAPQRVYASCIVDSVAQQWEGQQWWITGGTTLPLRVHRAAQTLHKSLNVFFRNINSVLSLRNGADFENFKISEQSPQ